MPLSEDQLNTIRAMFLESLNEHFPDTVRFTEAHVRNACTRCVDEYVRVNAIYESEQPELSPSYATSASSPTSTSYRAWKWTTTSSSSSS